MNRREGLVCVVYEMGDISGHLFADGNNPIEMIGSRKGRKSKVFEEVRGDDTHPCWLAARGGH